MTKDTVAQMMDKSRLIVIVGLHLSDADVTDL